MWVCLKCPETKEQSERGRQACAAQIRRCQQYGKTQPNLAPSMLLKRGTKCEVVTTPRELPAKPSLASYCQFSLSSGR